jgi:excisionase family DNA binding protein
VHRLISGEAYRRRRFGPAAAGRERRAYFDPCYTREQFRRQTFACWTSPKDLANTKALPGKAKAVKVKKQMSKMLTVKQLAQKLQVDPETVRRWAREKIIPAIKLSTRKKASWRFSLKDIESWQRRNTTGNEN